MWSGPTPRERQVLRRRRRLEHERQDHERPLGMTSLSIFAEVVELLAEGAENGIAHEPGPPATAAGGPGPVGTLGRPTCSPGSTSPPADGRPRHPDQGLRTRQPRHQDIQDHQGRPGPDIALPGPRLGQFQ